MLEVVGSVKATSGFAPHSGLAQELYLVQPLGSARSARMSAYPISFCGQPRHLAISVYVTMPMTGRTRLRAASKFTTVPPLSWLTVTSQWALEGVTIVGSE